MSTGSGVEHPAEERWRPSRRQTIAAVIAVVALVFILQNRRTAHFSFLVLNFEAPVWVWLTVIFGAGVATGYLIAHRRAKHSD